MRSCTSRSYIGLAVAHTVKEGLVFISIKALHQSPDLLHPSPLPCIIDTFVSLTSSSETVYFPMSVSAWLLFGGSGNARFHLLCRQQDQRTRHQTSYRRSPRPNLDANSCRVGFCKDIHYGSVYKLNSPISDLVVLVAPDGGGGSNSSPTAPGYEDGKST